MKKQPKLIREVSEIIDGDEHWWIKCKKLAPIETRSRPGCNKANGIIRDFFESCAGRHQERFESAYVRPYLQHWWHDGRRAYDHVNQKHLNEDLTAKIGKNPRGIKLQKNPGTLDRFENYLKRKYPEAFEKFEEIKKVKYAYCTATEKTNDIAWKHICGNTILHLTSNINWQKVWRRTPKDVQTERRNLDLFMAKAQEDYRKLKKLSGLPPRYLYREVSLAELQNNHENNTYAVFRGYYITVNTVPHHDSSRVGHGLGPLVKTDRSISVRRREVHERSATITMKTKVLRTFSGNFVLNALEEHIFLKLKRIKVPEELKPVQLNPKMRVKNRGYRVFTLNGVDRGFRTFERLFADTHYDYCVLRGGITYHGKSIKACIEGWKKKASLEKERKNPDGKIINLKFCQDLGYCKEGVRDFCNANELDINDEITVDQLKEVVRKNLSHNRAYYERELRQIGVL